MIPFSFPIDFEPNGISVWFIKITKLSYARRKAPLIFLAKQEISEANYKLPGKLLQQN